jgi:hypothetical protein
LAKTIWDRFSTYCISADDVEQQTERSEQLREESECFGKVSLYQRHPTGYGKYAAPTFGSAIVEAMVDHAHPRFG